MNALTVNSAEIEDQRLQQAAEMEADSGADWAEEFQPGTVGCHELLDRTSLLMDMLERHVQTHPACIANADWYLLAEQATAALRELYQQVGAEHLQASEPP